MKKRATVSFDPFAFDVDDYDDEFKLIQDLPVDTPKPKSDPFKKSKLTKTEEMTLSDLVKNEASYNKFIFTQPMIVFLTRVSAILGAEFKMNNHDSFEKTREILHNNKIFKEREKNENFLSKLIQNELGNETEIDEIDNYKGDNNDSKIIDNIIDNNMADKIIDFEKELSWLIDPGCLLQYTIPPMIHAVTISSIEYINMARICKNKKPLNIDFLIHSGSGLVRTLFVDLVVASIRLEQLSNGQKFASKSQTDIMYVTKSTLCSFFATKID